MLEQLFRGKRMAEVVEALARKFGEDHDLVGTNPNKLFEIFTAYCVTSQYNRDFDPEDLHAGESRDLSIDGYAIIINDSVYTNAADVEHAVARAPQLRVQFVLVQAKRSRKFEGRVFNSMVTDVRHVFSNEELRFPAGPKASNLRACITAIYRDAGKFAAAKAPRLSVWYASLGTFREGNHRARIEAAAADLRKTRNFEVVEVRAAGAHELRDLYHDAESMTSVTFSLHHRFELPEMPDVKRAVFGLLPAPVLVEKILTDEHGVRRQYLFHENMRDYLGVDGHVNTGILETLIDNRQRQQFAVLNNGITIVTRDMVIVGSELHLKDPQIVNGCQTCNVLLSERARLDPSVMVGIRIIESPHENVIDNIIRATNTQNSLSRDDLRAREDFPRHIEDFFRSRPSERRLYFERRARQYQGIPRTRIVSRRHLTQAYAAMWLGEPNRVTSYQALEAAHASDLFHPNDDPLPYYTCAASLHRLAWLLARPGGTGIPATYRPARFHLLYGIRLRLLGGGPLAGSEDAIKISCDRILDVMWHPVGGRQLVESLLPAITTARTPGLELASDVRTEGFTERFREAVLTLPASEYAAA
jgi:AIPR protein